jgi:hypothetical protein
MAEEHTLEQAIAMASRLDSAERIKLRQALDQMTAAPTEEDGEMTFKRVLLERGFISKISSGRNVADAREPHPVPVQGKPVSETIIEDRR